MTESNIPRRAIVAAALFEARYRNPEVAAYNRLRAARSPHVVVFWSRVLHALFYCHPRGCPTNYEMAVARDIGAVRASIRLG